MSVVHWMETRNGGTGGYDEAFSEVSVFFKPVDRCSSHSIPISRPSFRLLILEFDDPVKKVEWKCLEGGSKVLVDAMLSHLNTKPSYDHRVTSVEEVLRMSRDTFPNDRDWPRCPDHPHCPRRLIYCLLLP